MAATGSEGPVGKGNRLAGSTSPYLLQHKDNPVDWYPWGPEAHAAARTADKPIFLSIGYSACHWCHVMEEESFEDPATARVMNEYFVNIKVDREERPDLDEIYMTAVQMLTGSGGWPMSVWLTPDLKPFYGGTYFPPDNRYGRPSFVQILTALGEGWRRDRASLAAQAEKVHESIVQYLSGPRAPAAAGAIPGDLAARAVDALAGTFDHVNGGFGSAPKFPPHGGLLLMLSRYRTTRDENLARMAALTFDRMAAGGMYDQIGGGFHRYATDPKWLVPHFEKMLYDNALLADAYLEAWRTLGDPSHRRVAREIFDWVLREMTSPEGAFYSTLDADSEGQEGRFYVWRPEEVEKILGPAEASLFCGYYGITPRGNFEAGASIPHVEVPLAAFAETRGIDPAAIEKRLAAARETLRAARSKRVWPHLDDKILIAWNGMMIGALARGSVALDDQRLYAAAARAADFLLRNARGDDGLMRVSWRKGQVHEEGFLDDQAWVIAGLIALHEASQGISKETRWIDEAKALARSTDAAFRDPVDGGYFFTKPGRRDVIVRAKNPTDGAIRSGNSVMAAALIALHRLTGDPIWRARAGEVLDAFAGSMASMPGAFHYLIAAGEAWTASGDPARAQDPVVAVTAAARSDGPAGQVLIDVRLAIRDGWHINASRPTLDYLVPTRVTIDPDGAFEVASIEYPEASIVRLGFAAAPLAVYSGRLAIAVTLRRAQGRHAGAVRGKVSFQACNEEKCLAPSSIGFEAPAPP